MTTTLERIVYTAEAAATGGRAGRARLVDGSLELDLRPPVEMGGPGGGANPEQLFAMGYAACFQGALGVAGRREKVDTSESEVTCRVGMGPAGRAYALQVEIEVAIPGLEPEVAQKLVAGAHEICPYSNATRGNIAVIVTTRT